MRVAVAQINPKLSEPARNLEVCIGRLEAAAATNGVSVNTWLVQALNRVLEPRSSTGGSRRLTGYGRS